MAQISAIVLMAPFPFSGILKILRTKLLYLTPFDTVINLFQLTLMLLLTNALYSKNFVYLKTGFAFFYSCTILTYFTN